MDTLLTATDLHKSYVLPHKTVTVLQGASFTVGVGERVAIVGRSGTGKSTLLHLLGGLDRPDAGDVCIGGKPIYALTPRERSHLRARQIGFVFQSYHLLPEMDVVENVMLPAMAIGENHARARARVLELLAQVGLSDRATHTPLELSGGEQQRVALARALMNAPSLLLADEPTGNLDVATAERVFAELLAIVRDHGVAALIATHNPDLAARMDRTVTLRDGRLV